MEAAQHQEICQLSNVRMIIFHEPHVVESVSYIHPMACLFKEIPDLLRIHKGYRRLETIFKKYNIHYAEVTDVLKRDVNRLRKLAQASCRYKPSEELLLEKNTTVTEEYKRGVLADLDVESLVSLVYTRPVIHLVKEDLNTFIAISKIEINPMSNLVFIEDQQILTSKGIILCNSTMAARKFQNQVIRTCYDILRIPIASECPADCFIEGGDHMVLNGSLTLLQVGNRTNFAGAKHLMDNDLLGTDKFGVVKNSADISSERSHLDTFFNIVDPSTVIILNFDDPEVPKEAKRLVDLYRRNQKGSYVLELQNIDFEEFLKSQGYKVIKVSRKQQQELMVGFLHLGKTETNYVLLSCNPQLQSLLEDHGVKDVEVELVEDFKEVGKLEGSLHSALHVMRCLQR